ncbi:MAG TPA: AraC family transcriptional regulator [Saprospiraceae bacterium]|nr:AraC family transcriptional regulator [Saprospiraceae bacterium]
MEASKLYIKNMVCPRCIAAVEQVFKNTGLPVTGVRLGEVSLANTPDEEQLADLKNKLQLLGFELLDDSRKQLIEKIKSIIIQHIHQMDGDPFNFSEVLARELNKEYSQLSKLFSTTEGITIEQYVILQKVEKAKELIIYDQLNLSEIAYRLGYSSVAHLSGQFKKITGLTPSQFKAQGIELRNSLDQIGRS